MGEFRLKGMVNSEIVELGSRAEGGELSFDSIFGRAKSLHLLGVDVIFNIVWPDLHATVDEFFLEIFAPDPGATLGSVDEEEDTGISERGNLHRSLHEDHRKLRLHTLRGRLRRMTEGNEDI